MTDEEHEIEIYNSTYDIQTDEYATLYFGDCFDKINAVDEKSIDLILTDPPYWHKKSPGKPYSERKQSKTCSRFANSELFSQDCAMMREMSSFTDTDIKAFLDETKRVMRIMNAYYFCNETQIPYYCLWAEKNGFMYSVLTWEKPLSIINKNRFSQNAEFIVRVYDYGTGLNKDMPSDFYNRIFHDAPVTKKSHPTEKPVSICEKIVLLNTKKDMTVLDPFMGSGTTGVSAVKNGRRFIGIEKDPLFFKTAKGRVESEMAYVPLFAEC